MSVAVIIHDIANASDAQKGILREAAQLLREAVATPGFGSSVRQAQYADSSWQGRHGTIRQLDGEAIWDRIATGRERGNTGDHTLDFQIEIVPGNRDEAPLAVTMPGDAPIRLAGWFVDHCFAVGDRVNLAAHLMHHWMLMSGFVHPDRRPQPGDAPMVVARLVRRALEQEHGGEIDARATAFVLGV